MKSFLKKGIPVIMYHHVNNNKGELNPGAFEEQMKFLTDHGYHTIFLDDLTDFMKDGIPLPAKTLAITFDDGFLDNWVYVYPVLKKYNLKATMFVITSRIKDKPEKYRPNLEDVWNGRFREEDLPFIDSNGKVNLRSALNNGESEDFMTWEELKKMEESGFIQIESHTHLHDSCFASDEVIDFNKNDFKNDHYVLAWATSGDIRYGIPVYPRKSSLVGSRYFDDQRLRDYVANYVKDNAYFKERDFKAWKLELKQIMDSYKTQYGNAGFYESGEDYTKRVVEDLSLSKTLVETKLNKKCKYVCWPWGDYSQDLIEAAQKVGFLAAITSDIGTNTNQSDVMRIKRIPHVKKVSQLKTLLFMYSTPFLTTYGATCSKLRYFSHRLKFHINQGTLSKVFKKYINRWMKKCFQTQ